jgi:hypothetical protein
MFFILFIAYTIEFISAHIFYSSAADMKYKPMKCYLIGGGIFAVALVISAIFREFAWLNLITYVLMDILYACFCFKLNLKKSVFYGIIITTIGVILEIFVNFILTSISDISVKESLTDVFSMALLTAISRGLLFLSVLVISRFMVKDSRFKIPVSFFIYPIALIVSLSVFYPICVYCGVNKTGQMALAIISLILIVPTTLLFLIYQRSIEKETELLRLKTEVEKAETEKTYYSIIEKQNDNLRTYADDAQKHLEEIRNLNSDPQIEEYINKMSERLTEYSKKG